MRAIVPGLTGPSVDTLQQHVHPADIAIWCEVVRVAFEAARRLRLPLRTVSPDSGIKGQMVNGWCDVERGDIVIVLRYRHHETGAWMPGRRREAEVFRTLAHELAHLDLNTNCESDAHGPRFEALMAEALQEVEAVRFRQ